MRLNLFLKFIILFSCTLLLNIILTKVIITTEILYNSLSDKLSNQQIEKIFSFQNHWQWLSYAIIPIVLLIKTSLIACVLYIGTFFFSKINITFNQLWDYVITAEFVFLLVPISKIIWFYFFQIHYKLDDVQNFYPLSAINITGYEGLEPWLIYPFQTLNLFELAYWLVLAYHIGKITETNTDNGLKIVASSYGSALLLWVVVIMFFTLNYS